MNASSANSLLKFLEEPPKGFLALLETTALSKILPTIQSRCQVLHFQALSASQLTKRLQANGIAAGSAALLADLTNSFDKAVEISENEWFNEAKDAMKQWSSYLIAGDVLAFIYVQKKLVKAAKEKTQQQQLFLMLAHYARQYQRQQLEEGNSLEQSVRLLTAALTATQKLEANVAFQAVAEQLALKMLTNSDTK